MGLGSKVCLRFGSLEAWSRCRVHTRERPWLSLLMGDGEASPSCCCCADDLVGVPGSSPDDSSVALSLPFAFASSLPAWPLSLPSSLLLLLLLLLLPYNVWCCRRETQSYTTNKKTASTDISAMTKYSVGQSTSSGIRRAHKSRGGTPREKRGYSAGGLPRCKMKR